jgi:hypothetical protein
MNIRNISASFFVFLLVITCCFACNSTQNERIKPAPANGALSAPPASSIYSPGKRLVFPEKGAYTGAYVDFGECEAQVTLEAIEDFEHLVGKHQAIIASSSYWGEQTFPRKNLEIIQNYGAVPLLFWSPWDRPYDEERQPDRFSLTSILAGKWDAYIDQWADEAKAYGRPILVVFGVEMNGHWFPWSGVHYGANQPVTISTPQGEKTVYKGPETYKQAYRYVVNRVRARGATNILWGFHVNNGSSPPEPWNSFANYYPGDEYVDWLGLSVYGQQFPGQGWLKFHDMMDRAYHEICAIHLTKPLLIGEWGIGEFPESGDKAAWIEEAMTAFRTKYPRVKAAVFWHERWENHDGSTSNLRVNSSPRALEAYKKAVADSYWLAWPEYK